MKVTPVDGMSFFLQFFQAKPKIGMAPKMMKKMLFQMGLSDKNDHNFSSKLSFDLKFSGAPQQFYLLLIY